MRVASTRSTGWRRLDDLPLLWRVFLADALVLIVAVLLLALAPVTVSVPVAVTELMILIAGMLALLALNFALLRPAFQPLRRLVAAMRQVDPFEPSRRLEVTGGPSLSTLAQSFNEMLDRLERERRESA